MTTEKEKAMAVLASFADLRAANWLEVSKFAEDIGARLEDVSIRFGSKYSSFGCKYFGTYSLAISVLKLGALYFHTKGLDKTEENSFDLLKRAFTIGCILNDAYVYANTRKTENIVNHIADLDVEIAFKIASRKCGYLAAGKEEGVRQFLACVKKGVSPSPDP